MRITANLATRPFADLGPALKRLRIGMGVLALVAIGLGAGLYALHSKANAVRAREHSLDGSLAQAHQEQAGYQALVRQPDNEQVLGKTAMLNRLFDEKAFSWTLAMEDLETVLPGGVQVTTLEPMRDKKDGHITLRLRVVGPRDRAVELVQNLEHSHRFLLPRIIGESTEASGNGNQQLEPVSASNRVNFDVLADYNPATPAERKASKTKTTAPEETAPDQAPAPRTRRARQAGPQGHAMAVSPSARVQPPAPGGQR